MTMLDDILSLPGQLRWGTGLDPTPVSTPGPLVVLGMGGSAMAASVAVLACAPRSPVVVHRTYGLPAWAVDSRATVVAISYSGNTEEVLSGVDAAIAARLPIAAVSSGGRLLEIARERDLPYIAVPGGLQPRAGVGYQAAAAAVMLETAGLPTNAHGALREAADVVEDLLGGGTGGAIALGHDLADGLADRSAVIYGGSGVGATAAYRWKTQINENSKAPAFSSEVPEANHNELEGWRPGAPGRFGLIYLRDAGDHPAVARRLDLTASTLSGDATRIGEVRSAGAGPMARFFSLAVVGDVVSVAMAEAADVDPTPVDKLEEFKVMLAKGSS